ncbi:MAG: phosphodiester glycosidase family protein [Candidatus Gastranaerophilales bacterium]|nr:phosphodiester glycosidase family protein [Candidatus Gastranaerophilales bacterium]
MKQILLLLILIGTFGIGSAQTFNNEKKIDFYSPSKGIYIVDINTKTCKDCIKPYISDSLETVEMVAEKTKSTVAINAGFFDPINAKTTSYVIKDGKLGADPTLNSDLMNNPNNQVYIPGILNRSEFRIEDCTLNTGSTARIYEIARYNDLPQMKCDIVHSIQAGPALVPEFKLYDEVFVAEKDGKIVKESAGALGKYARSAIGIRGEHILLVAASNESPMTLQELADYMKSLNVNQAMAFDGGSSTSLYANLPDRPKFILTSAKDNSARRVKSILLVKSDN